MHFPTYLPPTHHMEDRHSTVKPVSTQAPGPLDSPSRADACASPAIAYTHLAVDG
jgi:hypothetical protein